MVSIENPVEIQLSLGNPIYRGPEGKKPVKGVDYFTKEDIDSIVAQIEGGEGIDLDGYATKEYVNEAVSGVVVSETDPTVPEWAKQATKPTYTANEVGALPADTVLFSGSYNDLTDKPTIPEVPANVSAFSNDAGYLTEHQSLNDYATKSYVETAIRGAESGFLKRSVVQALPTNDIDEDTIYMVAKAGSTGDVYDEYLYVNSDWEHIGSTNVDLTDYRKAVYLETSENLDANSIAILNEIYNYIVALNLSYGTDTNILPLYDIFVNGERIEYFSKNNTTITLHTSYVYRNKFLRHQYVWTKDETRLWENGSPYSYGDYLILETANSVAGAYPDNSIGKNFKYIKDNYAKLTDMPEYLTNSDILTIWNGENT